MSTDLTEKVMVRLDPTLLAALQANAAANERTMAQTVRLAIRRYLVGR